MIYRKVSRNEMFKALEDHAKMFNDCGILEWQKDSGQYMMSIHGATVFIDKFEINDTLPSMITMFQTVNMPVLGNGKTIDIMIGAISSHDWMVEIPEEGEQ